MVINFLMWFDNYIEQDLIELDAAASFALPGLLHLHK